MVGDTVGDSTRLEVALSHVLGRVGGVETLARYGKDGLTQSGVPRQVQHFTATADHKVGLVGRGQVLVSDVIADVQASKTGARRVVVAPAKPHKASVTSNGSNWLGDRLSKARDNRAASQTTLAVRLSHADSAVSADEDVIQVALNTGGVLVGRHGQCLGRSVD